MRLHRYFGNHADTTLRERRLLLAKVSDYNDPFEFAHRFAGKYTLRQAEKDLSSLTDREVSLHIKTIKKNPIYAKLNEPSPRRALAKFFVVTGGRPLVDVPFQQNMADDYFRVCCFSKTNITPQSEILLWSHYANSHRGVRIEFELDENRYPLSVVKYSSKRCAIRFSKEDDANHTNEILRRSMHTKSSAWSYEKEVRMIISKDSLAPPNPADQERIFLPFDPSCVKSVDFGINCDAATIQSISMILKKDYPHAPTRKASHHHDYYAIVYQSI